MVGLMCLAVAAGAAFARLVPGSARWRVIACAGALGAVLIDGWPKIFPMAAVPEQWPVVERRDRSNPIIELPLNLYVDSAAMFRTMIHGRRIFNGTSGYEPPAYRSSDRASTTAIRRCSERSRQSARSMS